MTLLATNDDLYLALMGQTPRRVPHFEHWSCPDAESYLTGIDYYQFPYRCRKRLGELYPQIHLPLPPVDHVVQRPMLNEQRTVRVDELGGQHVRWGDSETWEWERGTMFNSIEDVFNFSPLAQGDFSKFPVVEAYDYRDPEKLYERFAEPYKSWNGQPPPGQAAFTGYYNTLFMWPLLTFGWELFLEASLDERFGRLMDEFAELSRRVFKAIARLPACLVICHDDIVTTRGPTCSPAWMHRYIFPRYEEFFGLLRAAGKRVLFMVDGCMDAYINDVLACGASGVITEPYTNFRAIARKHPGVVMMGEGDNRVLSRNDPQEIDAMVRRMRETAKMTPGYCMCIGNHIPWNTPPAAIKHYLDLSAELAAR